MEKVKAFRFLTLLRKSEIGAAAAEYALILAIIGSVIAIAATSLGSAVGGAMDDAAACIASPTTAGVC